MQNAATNDILTFFPSNQISIHILELLKLKSRLFRRLRVPLTQDDLFSAGYLCER